MPAFAIQVISAVLISTLAGGRKEVYALPAVIWSTVFLIYPAFLSAMTSTDVHNIGVLSFLATFCVCALSIIK